MDALAATIKDLGGKPVKAPGVDFGDSFTDVDTFLQTAITFEDGIRIERAVDAMARSFKNGRWVELN